MDYLVVPPAKEVRGAIAVPPSKSATNRALVLAALSESPVEIGRPLESEDTAALVRCLAAMGARIERSSQGLRIHGPLTGPGEMAVLDAGESGTAARFLAALAAVTPGRFLLTGAARLRERPMGELVNSLASIGARIEFRGERGSLPLAIEGRRHTGGRVVVDASRSSQFLSALLLAGVATERGLEVEVCAPISSAPYVEMTIESLEAFGHRVERRKPSADRTAKEGDSTIRVSRGSAPVDRYAVPGDFSAAIPFLAAAGVAGGEVVVHGLSWPASDADARALPVLEAMGLAVHPEADSVTVSRKGELRPVRVRATDFPDAVPALAALASFAPGESRFEGIGHLRWKESDRIEALVRLLASAGGQAAGETDALLVRGPIAPREARPRRLPTANDHRIAMAGALFSLRIPGLLIENPGCVAKSYPGFFRDLESVVVRN